MEFVLELLTAIAKSSPLIACLIAWLWVTINEKNSLQSKNDELNRELRNTERENTDELNRELRNTGRENTETLIKVNEVLEEVVEDSKISNKDILNEIKQIKDIIIAKLIK